MTVATNDRLDDELRELRRRRTEQQRETRSLRLEVAQDSPGSATRLAESINREDELQSAISELDAQKQLKLSAASNGSVVQPGSGIFDSPESVAQLERIGAGSFPVNSIDLGVVYSKDEIVRQLNTGQWGLPKLAAAGPVNVPPDSPARQSGFYGVVPALQRAFSLLDLIPVTTMTGASVPYLQQQAAAWHAAETQESAMKPEGELGLVDQEAKAATIPVFVKVPRQQISDVAGLRTIIESHLRNDVMHRLQSQILNGDGTGVNIRGVLNTTGVGTTSGTGTDAVLDGIVQVGMSGAVADAVALHPADLGNALKAVGTDGQRKDSGGAFSAVPSTIWSLPYVTDPMVAQGTAIVGAWASSCALFIREPLTTRMTDSDQSDFVLNRLTILSELRAAFAVMQPAGFSVVDLAP
jgi:hypothetical protein